MKKLVFLFAPVLLFSCGSESSELTETSTEVEEIDSDSASGQSIEEENVIYEVPGPLVEDGCLPYPDNSYVKLLEQGTAHIFDGMSNPLYGYFAYHFDSLESKQYKPMEDEWDMGVYDWSQKFSNGITYTEYFGGEGGANATIYTQCVDKISLVSIVNAIANRRHLNSDWEYEGVWNEDSTAYHPDGAGCYYDIILDDSTGYYIIDNYCGC